MLGIKVNRNKNDIKIYGNPHLKISKTLHVKNYLKDHRVFMMSCVAAFSCIEGGEVIIEDKDSINTSFPSFLKTLKKLGAKIS